MKQNDDWEVGNKSIGDWLSDFWQDLDNVLYFPKTTVIGIPALIFVSLFFVPDGYAGMTTYTKSITSSQQNKWLFDVVYLSSIMMFINFHVARVLKADSFIGFRVLDETFGYSNNSKVAKVFYYGLFIFYIINMNSQSAETMRELIEQQRPFWANYLIQMIFSYYLYFLLAVTALVKRKD